MNNNTVKSKSDIVGKKFSNPNSYLYIELIVCKKDITKDYLTRKKGIAFIFLYKKTNKIHIRIKQQQQIYSILS